jgi:hypothetical protein
MMNELVLHFGVDDILEECRSKSEALSSVISDYHESVSSLTLASQVMGEFGGSVSRYPLSVDEKSLQDNLKKSAWRHMFKKLQIDIVAPAKDRKAFEMAIENPPDFTFDNIIATFGDYVKNPRYHILRGLAECFCRLDPAYKSHSKVLVGVKGLPKRVIVTGVGEYSTGWGFDQIFDTINAINTYDNDPLIGRIELQETLRSALNEGQSEIGGLQLRKYLNGNVHIIFPPKKLLSINRALAEFYGDVLPDVDETPENKRTGTSVSKDLQYYPTPKKIVDLVIGNFYIHDDLKILEPSCGDGMMLDGIRDIAKNADLMGIEVDLGRCEQARAKGHSVHCANFLEVPPVQDYDRVIMNPPFYGKHYLKHVNHAIEFLKDGGAIICILPASAWYDHRDELPKRAEWRDLPVGSFRDSGTNICTGYFTWYKPQRQAA